MSTHELFHPLACCIPYQGHSNGSKSHKTVLQVLYFPFGYEILSEWHDIVFTNHEFFISVKIYYTELSLVSAFSKCKHERESSALTLMLSANSSRALAPMVSMDVMSVGSLFLVLAAVPLE